jgi:hypothetical protein
MQAAAPTSPAAAAGAAALPSLPEPPLTRAARVRAAREREERERAAWRARHDPGYAPPDYEAVMEPGQARALHGTMAARERSEREQRRRVEAYLAQRAGGPPQFDGRETLPQFTRRLLAMARQGALAVVAPPEVLPEARYSLAMETSGLRTDFLRAPVLGWLAVLLGAHANACKRVPQLTVLLAGGVTQELDFVDGRGGARVRMTPEALPQALRDAAAGCAQRFLAVMLYLADYTREDDPLHANLLLFDRERDAVSHFEPHGLDLRTDLHRWLPAAFARPGAPRLVPSEALVCPTWFEGRPKHLAAERRLTFQGSEPLCGPWVLLFLHAALSVPDVVDPARPGTLSDVLFEAFKDEPARPNPVVALLCFLIIRVNMAYDWFAREGLVDELAPQLQATRAQVRAALAREDVLRFRQDQLRREDILAELRAAGMAPRELGSLVAPEVGAGSEPPAEPIPFDLLPAEDAPVPLLFAVNDLAIPERAEQGRAEILRQAAVVAGGPAEPAAGVEPAEAVVDRVRAGGLAALLAAPEEETTLTPEARRLLATDAAFAKYLAAPESAFVPGEYLQLFTLARPVMLDRRRYLEESRERGEPLLWGLFEDEGEQK